MIQSAKVVSIWSYTAKGQDGCNNKNLLVFSCPVELRLVGRATRRKEYRGLPLCYIYMCVRTILWRLDPLVWYRVSGLAARGLLHPSQRKRAPSIGPGIKPQEPRETFVIVHNRTTGCGDRD